MIRIRAFIGAGSRTYTFIHITADCNELRSYKDMQQPLAIKLCENTKSYKSAYPGSNKVVYGACEQESEEKYPTF